MYGTRDAGAIWENCYATCLTGIGFTQGISSPCCFNHPEWNVSVVVHGDDFTAVGSPNALNKFEEGMQKSFECKLKGRLGLRPEDCKEMRVLNRIVRVTDNGLLYEADPRHAEMLIRLLTWARPNQWLLQASKLSMKKQILIRSTPMPPQR